MANSTATAVKVLTPGPAGRSSPEGSQVSYFIYSFIFASETPKDAAGLGCCSHLILYI